VLGTVQHTQSVLDEILARGLLVPDELSIVGFGDEPGFRWWNAGLTTLAMPTSELATACGLWFLHQMKQGSGAMVPYSSVSPPKLIVRASTGAPAPRAVRAAAKRLRKAIAS
jgi:LacI family transcriptional regulator